MISKILRYSLLATSVGLCMPEATGQKAHDAVRYEVFAGTYLSTGKTLPYWMRTNRYGEVPLESGIATFGGQIAKDYKLQTKDSGKFSYGYGARVIANVGNTNQILLPEAYAKVRYGAFELYGGRRKEIIGLVDSTLSSGSYIWSGNALPIPKIQISLPTYTPILKNGLIAVKGNFSHGWFGSTDHVKNYLLHQKSLYLRLGKPEWHFKMHAGLNHQAQWGGAPAEPYYHAPSEQWITRYGNNFKAYRSVVLGKPMHPEDDLEIFGSGTDSEAGNRTGNHLGSLDVALEYDSPKYNVLLYRQSIYDDGSLYVLSNIKDGLNGISFSRKGATEGILKVVLEYLHTAHQGGALGSADKSTVVAELRGKDNYFYNGNYLDGWTYRGQTLGTPYIMPLGMITGITPDITREKERYPNFIVNNRIKALMIALQSRFGIFDLTTRLSFSENLGTYYYPFSASQTSLQQSVAFPIGSFVIQTGLFYDQGTLLEKNLGLQLAVSRSF